MSGGASVRQAFRVFVGNLPWTIGSNELRHFGSSFGPVVGSTVVFDRNTGLSKGYGFLTFGNREAFNMATSNSRGHPLEGNFVNIQPVTPSNNSNNIVADEY